jgi:hypothetical protein
MYLINEFSLPGKFQLLLLVVVFVLFNLSCEEKIEKTDDSLAFAQKLTCEGCHTNSELLQELAPGFDEQPPSSGGG